ncbi:MAG: hypothetical protein AB7U20_19150 [Planctomycetaceae bacterium]
MSYMFEVYYKPPPDPRKEADVTNRVARSGGRLSCREGDESGLRSICLTYEFDNLQRAEAAAQSLRELGEHVEGPVEYAS